MAMTTQASADLQAIAQSLVLFLQSWGAALCSLKHHGQRDRVLVFDTIASNGLSIFISDNEAGETGKVAWDGFSIIRVG